MKILLVLVCLTLTGCVSSLAKLPAITADSLVWNRSDPLGGGSITAKGIKKNPDGSIHADSVEWDEKYPQWTVHLSVTNYTQDAPATVPPDKSAPNTVPAKTSP